METVLENSINYIRQNYPEVIISEENSNIIFEGRFVFNARNNTFEINEAPLLKIVFNKKYPIIPPVCYDLNENISYDHVNYDKSLCLSTDIDIAQKLCNSQCISDYINELLIPFFLSYRYWEKYGHDLFGDYSHGRKGVYESIRAYLHNPDLSDSECYKLLLWASKTIKFHRLFSRNERNESLRKFLPYIKLLRKLGIPLLRKQLKYK